MASRRQQRLGARASALVVATIDSRWS